MDSYPLVWSCLPLLNQLPVLGAIQPAGLVAALLIGITLGLMGGGGSILTVPVLVYLFGVDPLPATAYSLFIVGVTSAVGIYPKYKAGMVNLKVALAFGIPSVTGVWISRQWLLPRLPATLFYYDDWSMSKGTFLMTFLALLMLTAALSMIKTATGQPASQRAAENTRLGVYYPLTALMGIIEGSLTGLVGAGGGFLIIPALVILTRIPIKEAIGTSLFIIAFKSLIGFAGDLGHYPMDWPLMLGIASVAIAGFYLGNHWGQRIDGARLKKAFGWFVLLVAVSILIRELLPA